MGYLTALKHTGSRPGHVHWIIFSFPKFVKLASRMTTFSARPRARRSRSTRIPRKQPRPLRHKPSRKSQKSVAKQSPLSFVYVGNVSLLAIIRPLKVVLISWVAEVGCPSQGPQMAVRDAWRGHLDRYPLLLWFSRALWS
jgi:hypothetical protein